MNVNHVAFGTTTVLAAALCTSVVLAATATNMAALVVFTGSAAVLSGASIASMTAWCSVSSDANASAETYFSKLKEHAFVAIAAIGQFVAQTLFTSLVQGCANGIGRRVERMCS